MSAVTDAVVRGVIVALVPLVLGLLSRAALQLMAEGRAAPLAFQHIRPTRLLALRR